MDKIRFNRHERRSLMRGSKNNQGNPIGMGKKKYNKRGKLVSRGEGCFGGHVKDRKLAHMVRQ